MKKLFIILLVMTFAVTAFTAVGLAQGPQGQMGAKGARYDADSRSYKDNYNRIELNEEQVNEIADLREEFYNETEDLRDQLRDLNRELRDLEFRGANYAEIGEVKDKIEDVLSQFEQKRVAHQEKIESVMTEEQLQRIEENRSNYEERFQGSYKNDFGPRSDKRRNSFSNRGFRHHNGNSGYGMMGRFNYNFSYSPNRSNRSFGHGAGWCY